jgi:hypothetical protein
MSAWTSLAGDGIFALRLVGCACKDKVGCSRFSHLLPGLQPACSSNHVDLLSSFILDFDIHPP